MKEEDGIHIVGRADDSAAQPRTAPRRALVAPKPLDRARAAYETAVGIMNPWGDMWTYETFETVAQAQAYLESYWADYPTGRPSTHKPYLIVPVELSVKPLDQPLATWPERRGAANQGTAPHGE